MESEGIEHWRFYLGDLHILRRCDAVLTIPGWQDSPGSKMELRLAKDLGIPVFHSLKELSRSPIGSNPLHPAGENEYFYTKCSCAPAGEQSPAFIEKEAQGDE